MTQYDFFLKYLTGNWLLNENLFVFKDRKQKSDESFIAFNKNINSSFYAQSEYNQNINMLGKKYKIYYKKINKYLFFKFFHIHKYQEIFFYLNYIRKGLFKIIKLNFKEKFKQEEYIYITNTNILVIIVLIKSLQNKYLGAKISSYIRIKKN
uniref:Uncharacterized protein n=1 Tax=Vertebrata australis TaxID=1967852 RepID=A0A1Z1MIY7_9FLOR|nr:hypothetical protein [Vertebrata australis]ARW65775.1 hypothetical protein [Vertebrata australis]